MREISALTVVGDTMRSKKARLRLHRRRVERIERVKPPPEAAQHFRAWPLQALLVAGHPDGIDAQEFEAALQIVETFRALTVELGIRGTEGGIERGSLKGEMTRPQMSDRDAERIVIWFEWSLRLPAGLPSRLVQWIEDELPIASAEILRRACRLWDKVRSDRGREKSPQRVDNPQRSMVTVLALRDLPARQPTPARKISPTFPTLLPTPHRHGLAAGLCSAPPSRRRRD